MHGERAYKVVSKLIVVGDNERNVQSVVHGKFVLAADPLGK